MQSKISFFNKTLFRKNLTRFWPLWVMASFGGALFPLAILLELLRNPSEVVEPLEFTAAYYEVLAYGIPIISLLYAILCAMTVWNYLYNARSVGLMHTLPIRRQGLFLTNVLSGMAMMLIPYVVTGGLMILVSIGCGGFEPVGVLVTILGVLGESFFYFSTATLVAFCVGNAFALPALYLLLHFLAVLMDWLVSTFSRGFIFGLTGRNSGAVNFLSPTVHLMERVHVNRVSEEVYVPASNATYGGYYDTYLTEVTLENGWLIGAYALAGVVCLALAYALYHKRRSESAGDVIAVGWMKPVFRYGGAALAALLGGLVLYEVFWRNYNYSNYYDIIPMIVCMLVAGTIGYYGASMLLAKSLKVFRKSWKGLGLVAVGCAGVCCVLHFDVLGITTRVPETGKVASVELYVANNHYEFYAGEDDALIEQVRQIHGAIAEDARHFKEMEHNWRMTFGAEGEQVADAYVRLDYKLRSGKELSRRYQLYLTRERIGQLKTVDGQLDQLVNSEAMKAERIHLNDQRYQPNGGSIYLEVRNKGYDLNSREAAAILEAVGKDAKAGTWGNYDWFESDRGGQYAMDLGLSYGWMDTENNQSYGDSVNINLRPEMENTIRCLKELGLVSDSDLKTYRELYPEDYDETYREYQEKYGVTYEEYAAMSAPATSVGIIGGADGPTAIYVTGA